MEQNKTVGKSIAIILAVLVVMGVAYFGLRGLFTSTALPEGNEQEEVTMEEIDTTNLGIEDTVVGTGEEAVSGKFITVHYVGTFDDGTVFDSSIGRGQPFQFILGQGQVIPGWDAGILGMKVGGKRILTVPSDLAYGDAGITDITGAQVIPGGATLTFEVELLGVEDFE